MASFFNLYCMFTMCHGLVRFRLLVQLCPWERQTPTRRLITGGPRVAGGVCAELEGLILRLPPLSPPAWRAAPGLSCAHGATWWHTWPSLTWDACLSKSLIPSPAVLGCPEAASQHGADQSLRGHMIKWRGEGEDRAGRTRNVLGARGNRRQGMRP